MNFFVVDAFLMVLLTIIGVMAVKQHRLFGVIILSGSYSLVAATWFVVLDAVDVAFTEAAVGAGVSTVLALATLSQVRSNEKKRPIEPLALTVSIGAGLLLLLAVMDMPLFKDPSAPVHVHVGPHYIGESGAEIGVPNIVTSVLASYRSFYTLGETVVVFAAAVSVFLVLAGWTRKRKSKDEA